MQQAKEMKPAASTQGNNHVACTRFRSAHAHGKSVYCGHCANVMHLSNVGKSSTRAGKIWWLTDLTPHESLFLKELQYRRYFRLVTSAVAICCKKHSTRNSLGNIDDVSVHRSLIACLLLV